ncbi:MAG: GYD domain-containing protein [Pseudonocardia sp.]|nr:GYD domain-containing protein [Pseudonocardia sp.]
MAKFAVFFSYTPQTWDQMLTKPGDRSAAVRDLVSSAGGTLESLYFMLGDRDGFLVIDVPEPDGAAALAIATNSTGAFSTMETRALIEPGDLPSVLEKAARARETYRAPGE